MISSEEVIAANVPFGAVTSSSELKPVTASENTIVTVDVSPDLSAVLLIVNELTVGAVVSITRASFAPNEPAAPTAASVSVALLPPASCIVPPFKANAVVET